MSRLIWLLENGALWLIACGGLLGSFVGFLADSIRVVVIGLVLFLLGSLVGGIAAYLRNKKSIRR